MSDDEPERLKIPGTKYTAEDVQVIALNLQDATEDLNDGLRNVERVLKEKGFGPVRVPIPPFESRYCSRARLTTISNHALFWDGERLIYEAGKGQTPLLSASRGNRVRAVGALPAMIPLLRPTI